MKEDKTAAVVFGLATLVIMAGAATHSYYVHQKEASKRKLLDIQAKAFSDIRRSAAYEKATPKEQLQIIEAFQKAIKEV